MQKITVLLFYQCFQHETIAMRPLATSSFGVRVILGIGFPNMQRILIFILPLPLELPSSPALPSLVISQTSFSWWVGSIQRNQSLGKIVTGLKMGSINWCKTWRWIIGLDFSLQFIEFFKELTGVLKLIMCPWRVVKKLSNKRIKDLLSKLCVTLTQQIVRRVYSDMNTVAVCIAGFIPLRLVLRSIVFGWILICLLANFWIELLNEVRTLCKHRLICSICSVCYSLVK